MIRHILVLIALTLILMNTKVFSQVDSLANKTQLEITLSNSEALELERAQMNAQSQNSSCLTGIPFKTPDEINEEGLPLTDCEAKALGMVEIGSPEHKQFLRIRRKLLSTDKSLGAYDVSTDINKAKVVIIINKARQKSAKSAQTLRVFENGVLKATYAVSTGTEQEKETTTGRRYIATTPEGYYRLKDVYKDYESATFAGADMKFAMFVVGGIAMHSTPKENWSKLGQRASGGCIRLRTDQAQALNELVLTTGKLNTDGTPYFKLSSWFQEVPAGPAPVNEGEVQATKKIKRTIVLGNKLKVLGVYPQTGVMFNTTRVDSQDTLVVIRTIKD